MHNRGLSSDRKSVIIVVFDPDLHHWLPLRNSVYEAWLCQGVLYTEGLPLLQLVGELPMQRFKFHNNQI